ncbi:MAG: Holliday junction branch migration protein RuvA [Chloroflexota bacterium]
MIASVRGTLLSIGMDHVVVEIGGLGLQVFVPQTVLSELNAIGSEVRLHTYTHIREDALALYGFSFPEQRKLFEMVLSVTGIGPKVALSILSAAPIQEIQGAIVGSDTTRLSRIPGIGKKTAERLVLELKSKIDITGLPTPSAATPALMAANNELTEMLVSLGFSATEANAAIQSLPADAPDNLEERLRLALRYFGSV